MLVVNPMSYLYRRFCSVFLYSLAMANSLNASTLYFHRVPAAVANTVVKVEQHHGEEANRPDGDAMAGDVRLHQWGEKALRKNGGSTVWARTGPMQGDEEGAGPKEQGRGGMGITGQRRPF
eukprot:Gb_31375 [translate_table: standard]